VTERIGLVGVREDEARSRGTSEGSLHLAPIPGRRAYVERTSDRWFILSAKLGLVDPDTVLEPYDVTLDSVTPAERRAWSERVLVEFRERAGITGWAHVRGACGFELLDLDFGVVEGMRASGAQVVRPAEGLGLFQQQAFYSSGDPAIQCPSQLGSHPRAEREGSTLHSPGSSGNR
jgi:hypothetical protein